MSTEMEPGSGLTPLHFACFYRRLDICQQVLERIGDFAGLEVMDGLGRTPIDFLPDPGAGDRTMQLFSWGRTDDWQLGDISAVRSAKYHSLVLTTSGALWSFGRGRLGCGQETSSILPRHIELPVAIAEICAAEHHCLAVSVARTLFAWGDNSAGQLGVEGVEASAEPILVHKKMHWVQISTGRLYSAGVTKKGEVVIWGDNSKTQHFQQVAGKPTIAQVSQFLKSGETVVSVTCSEEHSVILTCANNLLTSVSGKSILIHVPKQFAFTHLTHIVTLLDGIYGLGDNGDLFYLPEQRITSKKEHYVMEVVARDVAWISEGWASFVAGGRQGQLFEVANGRVGRIPVTSSAVSGSTNSNIYTVLMPCYRLQPASSSGLLSLADTCQHFLISTMVLLI